MDLILIRLIKTYKCNTFPMGHTLSFLVVMYMYKLLSLTGFCCFTPTHCASPWLISWIHPLCLQRIWNQCQKNRLKLSIFVMQFSVVCSFFCFLYAMELMKCSVRLVLFSQEEKPKEANENQHPDNSKKRKPPKKTKRSNSGSGQGGYNIQVCIQLERFSIESYSC